MPISLKILNGKELIGTDFGAEFDAELGAEFGAEFGAKFAPELGAESSSEFNADFGATFGAAFDVRRRWPFFMPAPRCWRPRCGAGAIFRASTAVLQPPPCC